MLGQFELICCDSISVFLRTEVVASAEPWYLTQLYRQFRQSPEFESIPITIVSVPNTVLGERFVDQFLGGMEVVGSMASGSLRCENVMRKKARIMAHWAKKIGAEIIIANETQPS